MRAVLLVVILGGNLLHEVDDAKSSAAGRVSFTNF